MLAKMPNGSFVDDYLLDREAKVGGERSMYGGGRERSSQSMKKLDLL